MKNIFSVALPVLFLVFSAAGAYAQEAPQPQFYELAFGTVQYNITGAVNGTETLYFDQWGMRQARLRTAETSSLGVNTTMTLNLGERIVIMDPNKGLGQRKVDKNLKQLLANRKPQDTQTISLELIEMTGGVKGKAQNVLGRPCDVWENKKAGVKIWAWKGIPLKTEMRTADGPVSYTAVQIDESTAVEEGVFAIPKNIRIIDGDINQILISMRIMK